MTKVVNVIAESLGVYRIVKLCDLSFCRIKGSVISPVTILYRISWILKSSIVISELTAVIVNAKSFVVNGITELKPNAEGVETSNGFLSEFIE